jgi:hypothetical protein
VLKEIASQRAPPYAGSTAHAIDLLRRLDLFSLVRATLPWRWRDRGPSCALA